MINDLQKRLIYRWDMSSRLITNCLFGLTLFIILAVNIFSFSQMSKFIAANKWVVHTHKVIQCISNGYINLLKIETAEREFLLMNNQSSIQEIANQTNEMQQNFDEALKLTKDNIGQNKKIIYLNKLLAERTKLIEKNIHLGVQPNKNVSLLNQDHALIEKISDLIEQISSKETLLFEKRNTLSLANLEGLNHILLVASLGSIIFLIFGLIVVNMNLSRKVQYLTEKRKYENLLDSIIDGTNDIIVALDTDFHLVIFNRSFENEFKNLFSKRPIIGVNILELLSHLPEEQKKVEALWKRALNGEEFNIIGEFGGKPTQIMYECNFNAIYDKGNIIGAAAICRNIERRIESEKFLKTTNEKLEHAYRELNHHYTEISLLNEMENSLQSCNSLDETLIIINRYCNKLLPFFTGAIYLLNSSRNYLELVLGWPSSESMEKIFSPNQCWGLRQCQNYLYFKSTTSLACEHRPAQDAVAYLCAPLLAQNEIIGLLHIEVIDSHASEEEIKALFKKNEILIKNLTVQLALAISNIQLREILKTRSIRDPLTGLYNRMYLKEFLERDLQRAERNHFQVSIVMLDIDHFKSINDQYGHDAGDIILKTFGGLLQDNIRRTDIACRYGGEEFLLIFPETPIQGCLLCVEKLREQLRHMEINIRGMKIGKITASFGLAVFPEDGTTIESLIIAADQALYHSKKSGRNQLTIYQQLISPSEKPIMSLNKKTKPNKK